jgi:hypothetical protein
MEASPTAVEAEVAKLEFLRGMDAPHAGSVGAAGRAAPVSGHGGTAVDAQALQRRDPQRPLTNMFTASAFAANAFVANAFVANAFVTLEE